MSLSGALSVASTGLRANQTLADISARNIANAGRDGYVRRDVAVQDRGGGVEVAAISRDVDATLARLGHQEQARLARASTIAETMEVYTATLGAPDDGVSIAEKLTALESGLVRLAGNPGDQATQAGVLDAAQAAARSLRDMDDRLGAVAREVDLGIRYDVADLNAGLERVADLNARIMRTQKGTGEMMSLEQTRDDTISEIAGYLDITATIEADGTASLRTGRSVDLVDGALVAPIRFDAATGTLSAGDADITPGRDAVRGAEAGSIAGLIEMRDRVLPDWRAQNDALARGLVETFEGADASLAAGQAGLFTDAGNALSPGAQDGLAGRIAVNAAIDPASGGALHRLRDGIGAAAPGLAGDATQARAFAEAFGATRGFDPQAGLPASATLSDYATTLVAGQNTARAAAQSETDALRISADTIAESQRNRTGVNTDDEMQKLMAIEQSYAANAKVMSTVSGMIDTLLSAF